MPVTTDIQVIWTLLLLSDVEYFLDLISDIDIMSDPNIRALILGHKL